MKIDMNEVTVLRLRYWIEIGCLRLRILPWLRERLDRNWMLEVENLTVVEGEIG